MVVLCERNKTRADTQACAGSGSDAKCARCAETNHLSCAHALTRVHAATLMEESKEPKRRGKRKAAPSFLPNAVTGAVDAEGKKKRRYLTNEFLGKLNEAKQKKVVKQAQPEKAEQSAPAPSESEPRKSSRYRFAEGNRWVGASKDDAAIPVYKVTPAGEAGDAADVAQVEAKPSAVRGISITS